MGKGKIEICPPFSPPKGSFQKELERLINQYSVEGGSNTPDFILAEYLRCCLDVFDMVTRRRDEWYGYNQPCNKEIDPDLEAIGFCLACGLRPCRCAEVKDEEKAG